MAKYFPSDIFWNSAREMLTFERSILPTAMAFVPFQFDYGQMMERGSVTSPNSVVRRLTSGAQSVSESSSSPSAL